MKDDYPPAVRLRDYRAPAFLVDQVELEFLLYEDYSLVHARFRMQRRVQGDGEELVMHGRELELLDLALDGIPLGAEAYRVSPESLTIFRVPDRFELSVRTRLQPQNNSSLEGLYKSRNMFCTQCEAEGFRKITYFLDRPDVMSVYTVAIEADRARYPVLLSNGNLVSTEESPGGRHRVTWHDPWPKPAYLFALVAGDLQRVEGSFTTRSGRDVALAIYVEEKDLGKCGHAMDSLRRAMRWDEERYGREYDLDLFNIVAVDDFNMGAMENKGLNIFNTSCVLCSPETTTDSGFQTVEAIVAHEYFHNWSGNRVTCRDWFQLSLKEGFTVFRDAQFSSDMGSPTVKRIGDVAILRTQQFAEDAGPMAHPVRPESYIEISNFYTVTVYEKGAEVVRMIHTLLGAEAFRRGSDLYFQRHDGQAVTCEDFVCAMEDASGVDLGQFRRWYSQAGTPVLKVRDRYDTEAQRYTLVVEQYCPPTPGQPVKEPFLIPLGIGLLGEAGNLPLKLAGMAPDPETPDNTHRVLLLGNASEEFVFEAVPERPVPSLLRDFSAPVRLDYPYSRAALAALMSRDDDGFVRWDSAQQLAVDVIGQLEREASARPAVEPLLLQAYDSLLQDRSLDPAMVAEMLKLPSENYLAELAANHGGADVDGIHRARERLRSEMAATLEQHLACRYRELTEQEPYAPEPDQIARRSLRNCCLDYLVASRGAYFDWVQEQFDHACSMTDRLAALRLLAFYGDEQCVNHNLERFYRDWQREPLVINQWFQIQATMPNGDTLERVRMLLQHPDFTLANPNKVRSLVGQFVNNNPVQFHRIDGAGYRLLTEIVGQLNVKNPQLAARLLTPLTRWRNYAGRAEQMRTELENLAARADLSKDVYEVVSKSLERA